MRRYYFHCRNGSVILDEVGIELADIAAIRKNAIIQSSEILTDGADPTLWDGTPWRLWVTDRPDGKGEVVCELVFSAKGPL